MWTHISKFEKRPLGTYSTIMASSSLNFCWIDTHNRYPFPKTGVIHFKKKKTDANHTMAPQAISVKAEPNNNGDNDAHPRAVALLFGWWGAEMRHVEKYAELYRSRGCATVSVIADTLQVMTHLCYPSLDGCVREAVLEAARIIRNNEKDGKKIPIILHAFSNAGTFVLERLEFLVLEARENLKVSCCEDLVFVGERLSGEIFDSAPAYPDIQLGFTSTSGVVFGQSVIVKILVGILFFLAGAISVIFSILLGLPDVRWAFWNNMREGRLCLRQVYTYSSADTIINVQKLEELIDNRKKFANVTVHKFEDAPHVQIMRKHPKEYEKMVDEFIRDTKINDSEDTLHSMLSIGPTFGSSTSADSEDSVCLTKGSLKSF